MRPDPEKRLTSALLAEMAADPKVKKIMQVASDSEASAERRRNALRESLEAYDVAVARDTYISQLGRLIKERARERIGDAPSKVENGVIPASIALSISSEEARANLVFAARKLRAARDRNR